MIIMEEQTQSTKKTVVTMAIDPDLLEVIDNAASTHQMSRTGFMVYSSLRYVQKLKTEGDNGLNG